MSEWKYFTSDEIKGLKDCVISRLDRARELFGFPIIINSGYRTPEQNSLVGGVSDSSHLKGLAIDIKCIDSDLKKRMIWALCIAGFNRVGVYERHIHVDLDDEKPSPSYWVGNYKNG